MHDCEQCATRTGNNEWSVRDYRRQYWDARKFGSTLEENWEMPSIALADACERTEVEKSTEERFRELSENWSETTGHISSVEDLTSHSSYQEIIRLGWDVVPLLLIDLQQNQRFWFPALYAITKVRPFDPSDAGNGKRMTDAWVIWGKRKGLI
jgi:hypothetical protein